MTQKTSLADLRGGSTQPQSMSPFQPPQQIAPMQLESAATALAAQAKAATEARYIMAMHRPRDWTAVRSQLLHECARPTFANNKSAYYIKPIGDGVEGLGIRFVEVALRCMTNVLVETAMLYEDDFKEVHRVAVTDLESNLTFHMDVKVSKTVERSYIKDGGTAISQRTNSKGKPVYTVQATDDDLLNKRGALISKAIRTLGTRIIPGDLQDEAAALIKKVRLDKAAQDPDAESKRIVDAFAGIRVTVRDLTKYLGHDVAACSPSELVDLRGIYGAIKDGEASWAEVMANKDEQEPPTSDDNAKQQVEAPPAQRKRRGKAAAKPEEPADQEVANDALDRIVEALRRAKDLSELDEAREMANGPDIGLSNLQIKSLDGYYRTRQENLSAPDDFGGME